MHSNTIFGFLVLAFFVHITAQGKLPRYMGFFVGPVRVTTPAAANAGPGAGNAATSVAFPGLAPGASSTAGGILSGVNSILKLFQSPGTSGAQPLNLEGP